MTKSQHLSPLINRFCAQTPASYVKDSQPLTVDEANRHYSLYISIYPSHKPNPSQQSLRQADITFQGGLIRMDTDGNMTISDNFNLFGKIDAVYGVFSGAVTTPALATSLITPTPRR